jgi:IclR family transcriptional regulator, KDG regulon repressor
MNSTETDDLKTQSKSLKSLVKMVKIMNLFTEAQTTWGITEIANSLKMPKSTIFSIVKSLEKLSFLEQDSGNQYRLGVGVLQLGYAARIGSDINHSITPLLEELNESTGLIVYFAIPHMGKVLYIESIYQSPQRKFGYSISGRTAYMHSTGLGKVMLAQAKPEEVDLILKLYGMPKLTEYTITDPEKLKAELKLVKEKGYAMDCREADPMIGCIAMPFRTRDGQFAGGISISGSYTTFNDETIPGFIESLAYTCCELSNRLYRVPFKIQICPNEEETLEMGN